LGSAIQQQNQLNAEVRHKVLLQMQTNKTQEEQHKQSLLHVETLNMMTKYQLVYIKLESALNKIL
jgi:hypothetical protein